MKLHNIVEAKKPKEPLTEELVRKFAKKYLVIDFDSFCDIRIITDKLRKDYATYDAVEALIDSSLTEEEAENLSGQWAQLSQVDDEYLEFALEKRGLEYFSLNTWAEVIQEFKEVYC